MKAKLRDGYIHIDPFRGFRNDYEKHLKFKQWIEDNKGKFIEIDTSCTFNNQYNTIEGYRIYDTMIQYIKDDVRSEGFFVENPQGIDTIKKCDFKDHLKNERFGQCYSMESHGYYRISRRNNIEFVLVDGVPFLRNVIGYTKIKDSRLTDNEKKILMYCVNKINEL